MIVRTLMAAALAASAVPALAGAVAPTASIHAEPAGKWAIEYEDFQCRLAREYTIAGKRTILSLELEPITRVAWLRILSEDKVARRSGGDAVMFADSERRPAALHYNIFQGGRFVVREYMMDLDRDRLGEIRNRIRFAAPTAGDIEADLGDFPAAWKALQACMTDLYGGFGIDQAALARMATPPQGSVYDLIGHPGAEESEFAFLYWVAADGRVDDCRLLKPSGIGAFDKSLCANFVAKAHFRPARDAAGTALRVPRFEHLRIRRHRSTSRDASAPVANDDE